MNILNCAFSALLPKKGQTILLVSVTNVINYEVVTLRGAVRRHAVPGLCILVTHTLNCYLQTTLTYFTRGALHREMYVSPFLGQYDRESAHIGSKGAISHLGGTLYRKTTNSLLEPLINHSVDNLANHF